MARKRPVLFGRIQSLLKPIVLALLGLIFTLSTHLLPYATATEIKQMLWRYPVENANLSNVEQLVQRGRELYQAGQFLEAADVWQRAVSAFAAQGDRLNQAMALSNLSLTWQQLGSWDKAEEALANSLRQLPSLPANEASQEELKILAQTLDIQGRLEFERGQPDAAFKTWQQAYDICKRLKYNGVYSLINQALAQQALGLHVQACNTLLQDLNIHLPTGETLSQLICDAVPNDTLSEEQWAKVQQTLQQLPLSPINAVRLRHLGDVLRILGALDKSKFLLKQSIAMASNLQLSQDQSAAMLSLGNTLQALGNKTRYLTENNYQINSSEDWCHSHAPTYYTKKIYEQALNYYGEAQEKASSPDSQFQALVNQLNLLTQLQKWPEFNQTSKKIEAQIIPSLVNQKIPKVSAIDYALINYAQSLACYVQKYNNDVPSWSNIIQLLETAVENAKNRGDLRTKAYALGYLGRIYEQSAKFLRNVSSQQELQERSLKAYKYTKEALVLAQSTTLYAPEIAYQWQWQLGRLLRDRGDIQGAIAAYSAAVETLNSLRSDLVTLNPNIQFDFKDEVEPVYRQLVDLLLQPEHENLGQARNVIEALQLAELNNFLRDVCVKVREIKIDKLDPKAAVIYPIILSDRLEVILSLPDGTLTRYSTPSPSEGFETFLETLNTILANKPFQNDNTASSLALPSLQEMYNWLIAPAETALKEKKVETLVFVLDGMLRSIPMAALYDGKQYLVEKYAIALTPSLQLLAPRNLEPGQIRVLAAGRTDFENNIPLPGWNNLVYVKNELEQIATVVPVEVLLNKTFTSKSLQTEINSLTFPIVHIATHGKFDLQAENTFIIAWDRTININELGKLLRVKDPSRLRDIELLVFSACQTATGSSRAILGMAGVAVRAGARSTVATLWNVNDKSTADLMVKLYQELKNSIDNKTVNKAEALRRAQLSLLKGDNERFRNPYYWASFVLVGNWL